MITYRTRGLYIIHQAIHIAATVALFWLCIAVNFWFGRTDEILTERHFVYTVVLVAGLLVDFFRTGGTSQNLLDCSRARNRMVSLRQSVTALGVLLLFVFAMRDYRLSRLFVFSFLPLHYLTLLLTNRYVPRMLAAFFFAGRRSQRTIVLGSVSSAVRLDGWLKHKVQYGMHAIGLVTNDSSDQVDLSIPILGKDKDLEQILIEANASQLLVAGLPSSKNILMLGDLCDRLGMHLLIVNDLEESIGRSLSFTEEGGFRFLSLRDEPLQCPINCLMKRIVDIAFSLPVVLFILPFTSLFVYICHRLQSPGPIFFRQMRTGKYGEEFLIFKYRTMHVAAFDEAQQATVADPRIFKAGAILRKLSIDELPQFLNVLLGDMSIVGPRPHLQKHDAIFSTMAHSYRVRASVRPGITGLAQVRGFRGEARDKHEIVNRVRSDIFYLENWSILMDTVIVFRTVFQMIFPPRSAV